MVRDIGELVAVVSMDLSKAFDEGLMVRTTEGVP